MQARFKLQIVRLVDGAIIDQIPVDIVDTSNGFTVGEHLHEETICGIVYENIKTATATVERSTK